jgi:hypothetical protein
LNGCGYLWDSRGRTPNSLYCTQRSVSMSSIAARNRKIDASPPKVCPRAGVLTHELWFRRRAPQPVTRRQRVRLRWPMSISFKKERRPSDFRRLTFQLDQNYRCPPTNHDQLQDCGKTRKFKTLGSSSGTVRRNRRSSETVPLI